MRIDLMGVASLAFPTPRTLVCDTSSGMAFVGDLLQTDQLCCSPFVVRRSVGDAVDNTQCFDGGLDGFSQTVPLHGLLVRLRGGGLPSSLACLASVMARSAVER